MVRKLFVFLNFGIQECVLHSKGTMIFPSSEGKEKGGFLSMRYFVLLRVQSALVVNSLFVVRCLLFAGGEYTETRQHVIRDLSMRHFQLA